MCCLTCVSLVVFVFYRDIFRAVYMPGTLSSLLLLLSFFFFFFSEWVCYVVLVYLLFALAVVCSDATFFFFFFFCPNVGLKNERPNFAASLSWSKFLSWRHWMTETPCVVTVCHFPFIADNELYVQAFIDFFICTKCRRVTCSPAHWWCKFAQLVHFFFISGAAIFWLQLLCLFFPSILSDVSVRLLVPLKTVLQAKKNSSSIHAHSESKRLWFDWDPVYASLPL